MNAIERLDQTIINFLTFINSIPADKLKPSLSAEWGAREIIIHLVFWHEQYVAILQEVVVGRNPKLLKGTFKETNHRAVKELLPIPISQLSTRFLRAQEQLRQVASTPQAKTLKFAFKEGGKVWPFEEALERIEKHIRTHLHTIQKLARQ
jgi:hypothetical protein